MNTVIWALGVVGLAAAAWFFADLVRDAGRHRQWIDIVVAVAVAALTVWLLFTYGGRLLQ